MKPFEVKMVVNKRTVHFEIDMGCSVSIMNESKFNEMWKANQHPHIKQTTLTLKPYTRKEISGSEICTASEDITSGGGERCRT